jgi:hypothetical protein
MSSVSLIINDVNFFKPTPSIGKCEGKSSVYNCAQLLTSVESM